VTSALLMVVSNVALVAESVPLTFGEDLSCLRVIRCSAVAPVDLGVLQDSIGVSEVVWKSRRRRLLRHLLNIRGSHTVISTCDDWGI
jgi:hypothetical protein